AVLPPDVAGRNAAGCRLARGADRDVEKTAMAIAVLLGRVRASGGVEVTRRIAPTSSKREWQRYKTGMESAQSSRKERELTPEAFKKLLAKLDPNPETAGGKYEELRRQLIKFFEWRGSFFPDELADETLNRVARKIDEGEEIEKNLIALALGIARFVFLETLKRPDNRRAGMGELATVAALPEPKDEERDLWCV